jgi:hypothetical protein
MPPAWADPPASTVARNAMAMTLNSADRFIVNPPSCSRGYASYSHRAYAYYVLSCSHG